MKIRSTVVLAPLIGLILNCGSKVPGENSGACDKRMFRYVNERHVFSVCLPLAADIVYDTLKNDTTAFRQFVLVGTHPLLSTEAEENYATRQRTWFENGRIGPEPVDSSLTASPHRGFDIVAYGFEQPDDMYPIRIPEEREVIDYELWQLDRDSKIEGSAIVEYEVKGTSNRSGKRFILSTVRSVHISPQSETFSQVYIEAEHYSKERSFKFRGFTISCDTTCTLECMEQDTTVQMYHRIIDSIDW